MTVPEAMLELSKAIDQREREINADQGSPSQDRADAKDLMRALARLLAGQTIKAAFGSPGDWGYSTPIGKTLAEVYHGDGRQVLANPTVAEMGVRLATRLTGYFSPVEEIEDLLECDIEIRKMADALLAEATR